MGWNQVNQTLAHTLWQNIANGARFYYVHSYFVQPDDDRLIAGESEYPFSFYLCHRSG